LASTARANEHQASNKGRKTVSFGGRGVKSMEGGSSLSSLFFYAHVATCALFTSGMDGMAWQPGASQDKPRFLEFLLT
jgi:hypothetical protein